jgi:hypothetical protein
MTFQESISISLQVFTEPLSGRYSPRITTFSLEEPLLTSLERHSHVFQL